MLSTTHRVRRWYLVHKWSSLACTVFLLLICLSGLPLVFRDEIQAWLDDDPPYAQLPAGTPLAGIDGMVSESRRRYPGQIVTFVFVDDDEPQVRVGMAPSWQASQAQPRSNHFIKFDARTGKVLRESDPPERRRTGFIEFMLGLHTDLFAGLPGELFLGLMGLLLIAATASGAVLYGPFMKKLDFGTVRVDRAPRLRWLDLHNLLGIVTLTWVLVVGTTGVINELSTPMFALWQRTDVQAMLQPWRGRAPPRQDELASAQAAFDTARGAHPGMRVTSVVFPGSRFGSPHHYLVWAKGETPVTSRLFSPTLVDARTGALAAAVQMPWYLRALEVSRPLHFGDYGGMPLKILWALLDLLTIVILGSGLYLWIARRETRAARLASLAHARARALRRPGARS